MDQPSLFELGISNKQPAAPPDLDEIARQSAAAGERRHYDPNAGQPSEAAIEQTGWRSPSQSPSLHPAEQPSVTDGDPSVTSLAGVRELLAKKLERQR